MIRGILFWNFCMTILLTSCLDHDVSKPNIVIINVDDMGWRDVGFMGNEYYETPNLDRLSEGGMVFTNGYSSAANCAPSRASLFTGKWSTRHGIYTVGSSERGASRHRRLIPTENTTTLSKDHEILSKILSKNGYISCHSGKWHLSDTPLDYGFHVNIGGAHNGLPRSYYPPYKNVKLEGKPDQNLTDLIMEKTLEFIDTVQHPFFLNYAPYAVHTPITAIDHLLPKYLNKSSWNGHDNDKYATMIENLDRNIGLLIKKLEEKDLFKNTMIVFTSDNGGLFGITNQHPLRAGKGSYYEGGIRVPFFFVMKDKIRSRSTSDEPITNLDILPTLLSTAQIPYDINEYDGTDLSPLLNEEVETIDRVLYWHFPIYLQAYKINANENRDSLFRTRPGSVIRTGKWKLHYYFEDDGIELYNLDEDLSEKNNLALKEDDQTEKMLQQLNKWWKNTNAPIPESFNPEFELIE